MIAKNIHTYGIYDGTLQNYAGERGLLDLIQGLADRGWIFDLNRISEDDRRSWVSKNIGYDEVALKFKTIDVPHLTKLKGGNKEKRC